MCLGMRLECLITRLMCLVRSQQTLFCHSATSQISQMLLALIALTLAMSTQTTALCRVSCIVVPRKTKTKIKIKIKNISGSIVLHLSILRPGVCRHECLESFHTWPRRSHLFTPHIHTFVSTYLLIGIPHSVNMCLIYGPAHLRTRNLGCPLSPCHVHQRILHFFLLSHTMQIHNLLPVPL